MSREPEHDERIMSDGRPAFAWWNEIQMLRADKARVDNLTNELQDALALLGIVNIALYQDIDQNITITLTAKERIEARAYTLRGLIAEMIEKERERPIQKSPAHAARGGAEVNKKPVPVRVALEWEIISGMYKLAFREALKEARRNHATGTTRPSGRAFKAHPSGFGVAVEITNEAVE